MTQKTPLDKDFNDDARDANLWREQRIRELLALYGLEDRIISDDTGQSGAGVFKDSFVDSFVRK